MPAQEPLDKMFDGIVGGQDFEADLDEQAYIELGERIMNLGILGQPINYFKFLGKEGQRLEVLTKKQAIRYDENGEPTTALRIICNRDIEIEGTRDVVVDVDDYLVDLRTESLAHIHSAVTAKRDGKNLRWQWGPKMAPHFWGSSGLLRIHSGSAYEREILPGQLLLRQDAATIYGMLAILAPLDEISREKLFDIHLTPHE